MKLKLSYTQFNTKVPRLVAKVYKVTPFGLPDGILDDVFTAKGEILSASAAATPAVIPAPTADGQTLIADSSQTSGWRAGALSVSIDSLENYLSNGCFSLAQRQTPSVLATITDEKYSADRWRTTRENADLQYVRTTAIGETGLTARFFGQFKKITNAGKFLVYQPLEHVDSAPLCGQTLIFQVSMKASSAKTIMIAIIELQSAATADTLPAAFVSAWNVDSTNPTLGANLAVCGSVASCSVTTSWQTFSVSAAVPTDTKNVIVAVWTDADYAANDTLSLAQAGLYRGNSQRAWAPRPHGEEIRRCQRYYEKSFDISTAPAQNAGTTNALFGAQVGAASSVMPVFFVNYKVTKMKDPIVTFYNPSAANAQIRNTTTGTDFSSTAASLGGIVSVGVYGTAPGGSAAGNVCALHYSAEAEL